MTVMLKNINLNSPEWCELVFTGKNKEYGAYELRKDSSSRHIRALLIVAAGAILIMVLPAIINTATCEGAGAGSNHPLRPENGNESTGRERYP